LSARIASSHGTMPSPASVIALITMPLANNAEAMLIRLR
jgi:hypothetical protein